MKIESTSIAGVQIIDAEPVCDSRGFFARTWCLDSFQDVGLDVSFVQAGTSHNKHKNTLRGLHFQKAPMGQGKLVSVTKGRIFDVFVDVRPSSPTYLRWESIELSGADERSVYLPAGIAHGFQTLTANTDVQYLFTCRYAAELAAGIQWNDPILGIRWPDTQDRILSAQDQSWPLLREMIGIPSHQRSISA